MKIIYVGDCIQKGLYFIHSRFKNFVNFTSDNNSFIGITKDQNLRNPINIIVSKCDIKNIKKVEINSEKILVDGKEFIRSNIKIYNSLLELPRIKPYILQKNVIFSEKYLKENSPQNSLIFSFYMLETNNSFKDQLAKRVERGINFFLKGDLIGFCKMFTGIGFGLTPSGDDFLCGVIYATIIIEKISGKKLEKVRKLIYRNSLSKRELSNLFLSHSMSGRANINFKKYFLTLSSSNKDAELSKSIKKILNYGFTSGSDIVWGLVFTLLNKDFLIR